VPSILPDKLLDNKKYAKWSSFFATSTQLAMITYDNSWFGAVHQILTIRSEDWVVQNGKIRPIE
jgi:hypothetical protein